MEQHLLTEQLIELGETQTKITAEKKKESFWVHQFISRSKAAWYNSLHIHTGRKDLLPTSWLQLLSQMTQTFIRRATHTYASPVSKTCLEASGSERKTLEIYTENISAGRLLSMGLVGKKWGFSC